MMLQAEQLRLMRERIGKLSVEATGQTLEKITQDIGREFWLKTVEALGYGLVWHVICLIDQLG